MNDNKSSMVNSKHGKELLIQSVDVIGSFQAQGGVTSPDSTQHKSQSHKSQYK